MSKQSNYRKYIAGTVATAIVASVAPTAGLAAGFTDATQIPVWAGNAVDYLVEKGAIAGYPDNSFKPGDNVKRGEAAKILAVALLGEANIDKTKEASFGDVKGHFSSPYIAALDAYNDEIIGGRDANTFDPNAPITREEMAKMVVTAYELEANPKADIDFTDVNPEGWGAPFVNTLASLGVVEGMSEGVFAPTEKVTRAQTAVFVHRAEVEEVRVEVKEIEELTSGIAGFILTGETRLEGATVTIGTTTVTTNEEGYFEIPNLAAGTHDVTIQAEGYATVTDEVEVLADEVTSFNKNIGELIDTTAIEVSGMIVDNETGDPLNAAVKIEAFDSEENAYVTIAEVDAVSGEYTIDQTDASDALELGTEYRQTVTLDGYKDFVQTITLDNEEVENALAGIELDAIAEMDVTGTVKDSAGTLVTNEAAVTVTINDAEGNPVAEVATVVDGSYKFEGLQLQNGTYNIVVDDETSAVYYKEFTVTEGTDVTQNVELEEGHTVTATFDAESVSDKFGTVDADEATYTLEILNGNTVVDSADFVSEAAGSDDILSFEIARVAPGNYTLRLSGDYAITEEFAITVDGDETLEERVVPAGAITGTVTGADGALVGATVRLLNADGNVVADTKTEAGAYEFTGVTAGDYTVEVSHNGYVSEETEEVTVSKNTETEVTAVALAEVDTTGDVEGYVRLAGSLTPVDATITYYDADGDQKYSDETVNGKYELTNVEAGSYRVVVRGEGIDTYTTTQTVAGGDDLTAVNFNPAAGGDASLTINVVDNEGNPVDVTSSSADLLDAFVDAVEPASTPLGSVNATAAGSTITFDNLSAGSYDLAIDLPADYVDVNTTAALASGEELEFDLVLTEVADTHNVNVRVVDETNTNEADAYVVVFNEQGEIVNVVKSSDAGTATLALVDGNYTLAIIQNGYVVVERDVTVAGENVTVPVVQLAPIQ